MIVVAKSRREAAKVRLGYLVGAANWWPQYRLRGGVADAAVRLEYLAAVVQHTGELWPNVRVTLSTARPSLEAAPPDLLPLKMAVAGIVDSGPVKAHDDQSQKILAKLNESVPMSFNVETPTRGCSQVHQEGDHELELLGHPHLRRSHRSAGS